MRWSTLTSLLCVLAPAANGAPVPIVLLGDRNTAGPEMAQRVSTRIERLSAAVAKLTKVTRVTTSVTESLDNSHFSPPESMDPSVVMGVPRPIETTYLMRFSASIAAKAKFGSDGNAPEHSSQPAIQITDSTGKSQTVVSKHHVDHANAASPSATTPAVDPASSETMEEESKPATDRKFPSDLSRVELRFDRAFNQVDVPCYYARMRQEYNDMLVIVLLAVFLIIIVTVEFFDKDENRSPDSEKGEGSIRLEADESLSEKKQQPLSVQASPLAPGV